MIRDIRFKGEEYLLIGSEDGAIAKREAYAAGECSYAHLGLDGVVRRFTHEIGTISDIEFLSGPREDDVVKSDDWLREMTVGKSWEPTR